MSSLADVREALAISYSLNIIDDVEFAVLYDANRSKPVSRTQNLNDLILTIGTMRNVGQN